MIKINEWVKNRNGINNMNVYKINGRKEPGPDKVSLNRRYATLPDFSKFSLLKANTLYIFFFLLTKILQMVILLIFVGSINNRKSDPGCAEREHQMMIDGVIFCVCRLIGWLPTRHTVICQWCLMMYRNREGIMPIKARSYNFIFFFSGDQTRSAVFGRVGQPCKRYAWGGEQYAVDERRGAGNRIELHWRQNQRTKRRLELQNRKKSLLGDLELLYEGLQGKKAVYGKGSVKETHHWHKLFCSLYRWK